MRNLLLSPAIAFLAGGLYALAYPSFLGSGWFPLIFVSTSLFLWQLEKADLKRSVLVFLAFNLGLNLLGYYWIPFTLREFGQLPYLASVILGALFSFILQPHWYLYILWKRFRPRFQWQSETGIILTATVMTLLEHFVPQQFPSFVGSPWLHLAPYLSLAPFFGVSIFSFFTYWVCLEVVEQLKRRSLRPQVWVALVIFVLLNAGFPLRTPESQRRLPVRLVQANVGNFMKLSSESGDQDSTNAVVDLYQELSLRDNGFRPQLIIWPETAHPGTFFGEETILPSVFTSIMNGTGAELLIGGYDQDMKKDQAEIFESVFNSSVLISDGTVKTTYHKNILIPFGETLPFGPFNSSIVSVVPSISLFARGKGTPKMETRTGQRFVTPICYEILESDYMRSLLNQWGENHFIVNHTNDSWYGPTAEPEQHLFLSKWRAIEFQLPIIRSTNTGISSVIFQDGSESARLGIGEVGVLDVYVPMLTPSETIYQRFGSLTLLTLIALLTVFTWWKERSGSPHGKDRGDEALL